ncbi:MAG: site-specific DNA-methyltransferase [Ruminococcus flavefaciens]|nr:site-specific DNA-methyltransferase [Ruminococcus flavefaciens]MCM1229297.1 site-specific DNA-methyltransferase [Ruminococcus flavefaciens]
MLCYTTKNGEAYCGDSLELINNLENESVDLLISSPPYALVHPKEYGNKNQTEYVCWLKEFINIVIPKIKKSGSIVLDFGAVYNYNEPSYSIYNFKILIMLVEECGLKLCQPFYWNNPSKLPSPTTYVNRMKIRAKDSVNTIWWLSKTSRPKADITKVLQPYSKKFKQMLKHPEKRQPFDIIVPSGHIIHQNTWKDNGGSIPSNMLSLANTNSREQYLIACKKLKINPHPCRMPRKLIEFFVKYLTDEQDLVIDIFAGSNTMGMVCEELNRHWKSFELSREYVSVSAFRFISDIENARKCYDLIMSSDTPVDITVF